VYTNIPQRYTFTTPVYRFMVLYRLSNYISSMRAPSSRRWIASHGNRNRGAKGLWKSIWRVDCFRAKTRRRSDWRTDRRAGVAVGVRHGDNVAIMYPFTSGRARARRDDDSDDGGRPTVARSRDGGDAAPPTRHDNR